MKIGCAIPRLKKCKDDVIQLASTFPVVTPVDWLCPSTLVFDGATRQHSIIGQMQHVRGHCLIAAKPAYMPSIWGGNCKGLNWAAPRQNLSSAQQLAVLENHISQTVKRFRQVTEWDLIAGNVRADGHLRIPEWKRLLERAVVANPNNTYWLDELLCTSYPRWLKIAEMASDENIAGVGIQVHANASTDVDKTLAFLERVLKLTTLTKTPVNLSEIGYWSPVDTTPDTGHVKAFVEGVKQLGEQYEAQTLIWWGLVSFYLHTHLNKPEVLALFDRDRNPTFIHDILC